MTFKLKAWMVYLIGLGVYSIFVVGSSVEFGWVWDFGLFSIFGASIAGGIILGFYYMIKSILKRKQKNP